MAGLPDPDPNPRTSIPAAPRLSPEEEYHHRFHHYEEYHCGVHHIDGCLDMLRFEGPVGVSHVFPEFRLPFVVVVAAKADVHGTGYGGFGVSPIGRRVLGRIPEAYFFRIFPVQPEHGRSGCEEEEGNAGGDVVQYVVHAGGETAEEEIAVVFVAQHGVHGVAGTVEGRPYGTEEEEPEERGDDAVGGVFRNGFHGAPGDFTFIQIVRVPSYDPAESLSGCCHVPRFEKMVDFHAVPGKSPGGDGEIEHHCADSGVHENARFHGKPGKEAHQKAYGEED